MFSVWVKDSHRGWKKSADVLGAKLISTDVPGSGLDIKVHEFEVSASWEQLKPFLTEDTYEDFVVETPNAIWHSEGSHLRVCVKEDLTRLVDEKVVWTPFSQSIHQLALGSRSGINVDLGIDIWGIHIFYNDVFIGSELPLEQFSAKMEQFFGFSY